MKRRDFFNMMGVSAILPLMPQQTIFEKDTTLYYGDTKMVIDNDRYMLKSIEWEMGFESDKVVIELIGPDDMKVGDESEFNITFGDQTFHGVGKVVEKEYVGSMAQKDFHIIYILHCYRVTEI